MCCRFLLLIIICSLSMGCGRKSNSSPEAPLFFFPQRKYEFKADYSQESVKFDIPTRNTTRQPVSIRAAETSCWCLKATPDPVK
jgi:hypothetical protein